MKPVQLFFLLAIGWLIICTILFCLPASAFPKENWLNLIYFDKWVHMGLFSVLVFLWSVYVVKKKEGDIKSSALIVGISALVYGIAIEFIQKYFIPNRSFDVFDIMADGVGCVFGYFAAVWYLLKTETPVETGVVNQN